MRMHIGLILRAKARIRLTSASTGVGAAECVVCKSDRLKVAKFGLRLISDQFLSYIQTKI